MTKTQEIQENYAIQQLTGFDHARQGFSTESLLDSMGLYQDEWERIKDDCNFLSDATRKDIELYFSHVDTEEEL